MRAFHLEWSIFVNNINLLGETQRINAQERQLIAKGVIIQFRWLMFFSLGIGGRLNLERQPKTLKAELT
jgi:hypothetical protein